MSGGYLPFLRQFCFECLTPQGKTMITELEHQANLGTITETQFYKKIKEIFHLHLTPKEMHRLIVKKMQPNKSLIKFIPHLRPAQIAMFTNSIGHMSPEILRERHVPAKKIFAKVFISSRIHLAKPETKAYAFVVKKLGLKPRQVLMVDDRPENIVSAKKFGMQGIVFKNTAQFKKAIRSYDLAK